MARTPSERELAGILIGHGIVDFVSGGRLTKIERDALWKVLKKLGPAAVTTTGRLAGTAAMAGVRLAPQLAGTARFIAMKHPYLAGAIVTYEVIKHREEIAALAREGWEVIEPPLTAGLAFAGEGARVGIGAGLGGGIEAPSIFKLPKKRPSKYNRAMSAAMKAVKASPKGGKKGTISNPKSVFKTVSKAVSKVNRGSRVGKTGITGIAARAAKRIIGKVKRRLKR